MDSRKNLLMVIAFAVACCLAVLHSAEAGRRGRGGGVRVNHIYDHYQKFAPKYVLRYVPVPSPYYVPFPVHVGGGGGGRDKVIVVNSGGNGGGSDSDEGGSGGGGSGGGGSGGGGSGGGGNGGGIGGIGGGIGGIGGKNGASRLKKRDISRMGASYAYSPAPPAFLPGPSVVRHSRNRNSFPALINKRHIADRFAQLNQHWPNGDPFENGHQHTNSPSQHSSLPTQGAQQWP